MGSGLAKSVGGNCEIPLVDFGADDEEAEERWCCCPFGQRHTRDVEAVPEASKASVEVKESSSNRSGGDQRSPVIRDVNLTLSPREESQQSSELFLPAASAVPHGEQAVEAQAERDAKQVPECVRRWAESAATSSSSSGKDASPEVAGVPLEVFWQKLQAIDKQGGKDGGALARAEKVLSFRQRFAWPLTIGARHIEKALSSGSQVYLPPRHTGDRPMVIFVAEKLSTRLCTMEEYQKLAMFMLEAAFRDASAERGNGVTIVLDVRRLSSVMWQALLSGFSDVSRGIAMCSGALPVKASHVQLIEDEHDARVARYAVSFLLSKLSSKLRSRVNRGGLDEAVKAIGKETLPLFLGGLRDSTAEFLNWLQQLQIADAAAVAAVAAGDRAETPGNSPACASA